MITFNKYVEIEGNRYEINPDYRNIIEIDTIWKNKDLTDEERVYISLNKFYLFFDKYPQDLHESLAKEMINFYQGGIEKGKSKGKKTNVAIFDYQKDWDMIYSAFYECYNIRLTKYMHWWEFKMLFDSLDSECKFSKVRSYRSYSGSDKEMNKLKKEWALPIDKVDEERYNAIYDKLKGE